MGNTVPQRNPDIASSPRLPFLYPRVRLALRLSLTAFPSNLTIILNKLIVKFSVLLSEGSVGGIGQ